MSVARMLRFGRGRRRLSLGVVVVAVALTLVADRYDPVAPASPAPTTTVAGGYTAATVVRVTDGDTIRVRLDGSTMDESLRLIGVETPETVHPSKPDGCYGPEASEFTKQVAAGRTVTIEWDEDRWDRYDRLLGYVWLAEPAGEAALSEHPEMMLNTWLAAGGFGKAVVYRPNDAYAPLIAALEGKARAARLGLWAACRL